MKKTYFLLLTALCALMSLTFTSCDDDEDNGITVPTQVVGSLSFTGETTPDGEINGTINWVAPSDVSNITKYVIYQSADGKAKEKKLGEVAVGTNSYTVEEGTPYSAYLLVVAANLQGESESVASVSVAAAEVTYTSGLYILNSGSYQNNNASLYFYDLETKEVDEDVFYTLNNRRLGDTAQDIIVYGSKMYISVYGSETIEVTDLKGKSLKQIKPEGTSKPRYLASHDGKVYVTYYDGYVARLDTASLEIEQRIQVGRNPDHLVVANNKLYVANSGGLDLSNPIGLDNTVSVIDLVSFTETKKIEVVPNPCRLIANTKGDVFLASWGNYGDIPYTFQRIDTTTDEASSIENPANATEMGVLGNTAYILYSVYGADWSIYVYDTASDSIIRDQFITDGTEITSPYGISSSSTLNYVFIGESDYRNTGDIYIFKPEGTLVDKVAAGLNPMKVVDVKYTN